MCHVSFIFDFEKLLRGYFFISADWSYSYVLCSEIKRAKILLEIRDQWAGEKKIYGTVKSRNPKCLTFWLQEIKVTRHDASSIRCWFLNKSDGKKHDTRWEWKMNVNGPSLWAWQFPSDVNTRNLHFSGMTIYYQSCTQATVDNTANDWVRWNWNVHSLMRFIIAKFTRNKLINGTEFQGRKEWSRNPVGI